MWLEVEVAEVETEIEIELEVESVAEADLEAAEAAAVSHNRLGWPLHECYELSKRGGYSLHRSMGKNKKLFEMWIRYMQIDGSRETVKNKIRIDAINKCRVNFQLTVLVAFFFFLYFLSLARVPNGIGEKRSTNNTNIIRKTS